MAFGQGDGVEKRFDAGAGGRHVLERLLGTWRFVREVPGQAHMTGRASITLAGEGRAEYDEVADVTLVGGQSFVGKQRYLYRRLPAPAHGFDVLFCDTGELFQSLEFYESEDGKLRATARHVCRADLYDSQYELDREDRLHVQHTVRGPQKDYVVRTVYRRESADRAGHEARPPETTGM